MRAEVTVRGAGVTGLGVALACLRRGARVRVVDPRGVGAGASGGLVGALAPHAPERWDEGKALQLRALLMAGPFWAGVREAGGLDPGFARLGRLMPIPDERALAGARAREGSGHWPAPYAWTVEAAEPGWGPAAPLGLRVRDTLAARIDPRPALASLAAAVRALGGEIAAEGADEGAVVEATGAQGLAARGIGGGVKGQAARLALDLGGAPMVHAGGLWIVPQADGTVAVGSTSEPEAADPASTDGRLDAVIARAAALVPALLGAPVVARWAGLRPRAADGMPVVGRIGAGPILANGGFRIGYGLAPLVAEMVAALALDGRDEVPGPWRADRLGAA